MEFIYGGERYTALICLSFHLMLIFSQFQDLKRRSVSIKNFAKTNGVWRTALVIRHRVRMTSATGAS